MYIYIYISIQKRTAQHFSCTAVLLVKIGCLSTSQQQTQKLNLRPAFLAEDLPAGRCISPHRSGRAWHPYPPADGRAGSTEKATSKVWIETTVTPTLHVVID